MTRWCVLGLALALGVAACGGAPVPNDRVASATASISAAEAGGATASPQATLHLKRAKEQLAQAKGLIKKGDNEEADWMLQQAAVDAELALALGREEAARAEAQRAKDEVKKLQEQLRVGPQS